MGIQTNTCTVDTVLFDFGGVLAEKGFEEGLKTIALRNGLRRFLSLMVFDVIHATGYLTGHSDEHTF